MNPGVVLVILLLLLLPSARATGLDEDFLRTTQLNATQAHILAGVGMGAVFQTLSATKDRQNKNPYRRLGATMAGCLAVSVSKEAHDHFRKSGWDATDIYNSAGPPCLVGAIFVGEPLAQAFIYVAPKDDGATASLTFFF